MSPPWLAVARSYIGQREIPGPESNPWIKQLWINLKAAWLWNSAGDDSKLAWCGTFCAHVMQECGISRPVHWYRARAWLDWGVTLEYPYLGCIAVFERNGGGHVGFVVGYGLDGTLAILGGNQGNAVSVAHLSRERLLGYRWPSGTGWPPNVVPPLVATKTLSTNEA